MISPLDDIARRWSRYDATSVSQDIASCDTMFAGNIDHYMRVGRSAVELLASAMLAARKPNVLTLLDLPCGAGRVTRHLRAFFPDAELFVSDIDKPSQNFAAAAFQAQALDVSADFTTPIPLGFDLIFCGSLLTHLPAPQVCRALEWLCAALAPEGLLVVTLHGRRADHAERNFNRYIDPARWERVRESVASCGFGFIETERVNGAIYGLSLAAPSWMLRAVETQSQIRIITYQEAAWSDHHDVLALQRKSLDLAYEG